MKTHDLKSWPDFFDPVYKGTKNFELRKDDRHYQAGDVLLLREFDDRTGKYTGREVRKRVTYVLQGVGSGGITPVHGLNRGYSILSLTDEAAHTSAK